MRRNVRGGSAPDLLGGYAIASQPSHIAREKLLLGGACFDAQTGVFRDARDLVTLGKHNRLADPHQTNCDAGGFSGSRISQVDAEIGGGGVSPEIGFGEVIGAEDPRIGQLSVERALQIRGGERAGDEKARFISMHGAGSPCLFHRAEHDRQAFRLTLVTEEAYQQRSGAEPKLVAESQRVDFGRHCRRHEEMRDFDDVGIGRMPSDHRRGGGIVNDDRARGGGNTLQHGPREVARIRGGAGAMLPKILRQGARPFAIIENKFVNVLLFGEAAKEEMLLHGVMQDDNAGYGKGAIVYRGMKLIVADVIKGDL